ncbi:MAG TPA: tetratricopeptide repeat protein, partial [Myxococcota bacterium]|nr:tetratricopeptide repeat protein [Myxococcota bacterium]
LQVLPWLDGPLLQKVVDSGLSWMEGGEGSPEDFGPADLPANIVHRVRGWAAAVGLAQDDAPAEALAQLQRLEGLVEPDLELSLFQAELSFQLEQVEQAQKYLDRCLQLYPYQPARRLRIRIAEARADTATIIRERTSMLADNPGDRELAQQVQEDLAAQPDYAPAWYQLGKLSAEEEEDATAIPLLRRALGAEGLSVEESAVAWSMLALCLKRQGKPWLEEVDRALALDPTLRDALQLRAEALEATEPAEVVRLCEALLQDDPENAPLHWLRARALLHLGRPAEALWELEYALRRLPDRVEELRGPLFAALHGNPNFENLYQRTVAGEFDAFEEPEDSDSGPEVQLRPLPTLLSREHLRRVAASLGLPWVGHIHAQPGRPEHISYLLGDQVITWTESCALDVATLWIPDGCDPQALQPLIHPSTDPTFALAALACHPTLSPVEVDRLKDGLNHPDPRVRWTATWVLSTRLPSTLAGRRDADPSVQVLLDLVAGRSPAHAENPLANAPPEPTALQVRVAMSRGELLRLAWQRGWLLARVILPTDKNAFEMVWMVQSPGASLHDCRLHYIEHAWLEEHFLQLHGPGRQVVADQLGAGFERLPELVERLRQATTAQACIPALRAVVALLGEASEPEAAGALHPLGRHPEREVRLELLRALAWRSWRDSLALVLPMISDAEEEVRSLAERVATMLREKGCPEPGFVRPPPLRAWLPPREEFLRVVDRRHSVEEVLHAARHLVWNLAIPDEEGSFLQEVHWQRGEEDLLLTLHPALDLLFLRCTGAELLGEMEEQLQLWSLDDLPKHPDPAFSLGILGMLQPNHPELPALFQRALVSADADVRYRGVLAAVGAALPGLPDLLVMLQEDDPEAEVRALATNALRMLEGQEAR